MSMLRGIFDRIILVVGIVAAGCIPSFIVQYRQRLGGRLDQVLQDLSLFQDIANKFQGGSLQALIQHHLASTDASFYQEGAAIQTMVDTAARLRKSMQALNTDLWHQLAYLMTRIDADIARATWQSYVPSFNLSLESVVFSLSIGVSVWLIFLAVWQLGAHASRKKIAYKVTRGA